jgi:hypothetical protein
MRHRSLVVMIALVALLAAACAGDETGGAGLPPAATPAPSPTPTPTPRPAAPTVTLVGEVQAGVEAGCLLLAVDGGGGSWLLLGGDRSVLRPGARVRVTGSEAHGIATTCQQGRPFQVRSAAPA